MFESEKDNCFDDQPLDEYAQLCYLVKLGQVYKARDLAIELKIEATTELRLNGDTIMHVCAEYGQVKLFEYFCKELGASIEVKNKLEETPFTVAAREGRILILKMFYDKFPNQFNPDSRSVDGWTAFSYACINGFLNTIEFWRTSE